jgi:hypothetical protein
MEGPRVVEPTTKIPLGEPLLPPLPASTVLHVAHLILAGKVTGAWLQQKVPKRQALWVYRRVVS